MRPETAVIRALAPRRKQLRLREYDYSHQGMYFITVCTESRACVLATERHGEIVLSAAGQIVLDVQLFEHRFESRGPQRKGALDVERNTGCVVPKSSFSRGWMPP